MRRLVLLVLLAACSAEVEPAAEESDLGRARACVGADGALRWRLSPAWPDEYRRVVLPVLGRWNAFVGREVVAWDDGARCEVRPGTLPAPRAGWYDLSGDVVVDVSRLPTCDGKPLCVSAVVLHEVGHALGLWHTTRGIMRAEGDVPYDFTEEDRAECRRVRVCR